MSVIIGFLILAAVVLLCFGALAGIVILALLMRRKVRKIGYILGIIACSCVPFTVIFYFVLAALLLNGIQ